MEHYANSVEDHLIDGLKYKLERWGPIMFNQGDKRRGILVEVQYTARPVGLV